MEPTISDGDWVLSISRPFYGPLSDGDLVVFKGVGPKSGSTQFVKRIAHMPGDTLEDYTLHNHESLTELKVFPVVPLLGDSIKVGSAEWFILLPALENSGEVEYTYDGGKHIVNGEHTNLYIFKQNYFFLLGDNEDQSTDSRTYGPVSIQSIESKVVWPG